ncbi:MAG TPA: discoidin domain-containing protein [Candidatus Sumerlaeota bacterium]|nr:discoidin domain-containing protein [Candidatus Sumerlaeota bacterium]
MRAFSFLVVACFFIPFCLVGCTSLDTATTFNDLNLEPGRQNVCHVNGRISGLYLFSLPIVTGDPAAPGEPSIVFFENTANLNRLADMMSRFAKQQGASDLVDVNSSSSSFWLFPTFVLFWRTEVMSANAVVEPRPASHTVVPRSGADGLKPPALDGKKAEGPQKKAEGPQKKADTGLSGVQSAVVELQEKRNISEVTIQWGATAAAEYDVLVSQNKSEWQPVASVSDGVSGEKRDLKFKSVDASYIKVLAKRPTGPGEYTIVQMLAS